MVWSVKITGRQSTSHLKKEVEPAYEDAVDSTSATAHIKFRQLEF
jgi:hypothetical protein